MLTNIANLFFKYKNYAQSTRNQYVNSVRITDRGGNSKFSH